MLFLYLAILIPAMFWVIKVILPEMAKPVESKAPKSSSFDFSQSYPTDKRIEKLETLLAEKNKNIQLLQKELKIFHAQIRDFDKVKTLFEEETRRLREQNRIFRSELGLSSTQSKEGSII